MFVIDDDNDVNDPQNLDQGSENYDSKSSPLPACVNTVLSEHSTPIQSRIIYGCFHATKAEMRSWDRNPMAHKALRYLLSGSLTEKVPQHLTLKIP